MKERATKARPKNSGSEDTRTLAPPSWASLRDGALRLALHVQPGARRTGIEGLHGTSLKIALRAPPVDGKANEALVDYFAQLLGVRRAQVRVVAGMASREKVVEVACGPLGAPGMIELLVARLAV